ncbi:NAD(P)-binding protein [Curvibacter sp. APW13]|uniref:NAD(P)-binding protein n=1 Tax=Curvibacter sp. APW13 TaxID=3077236 RepID=UPI0028DE1858|nr:NAD(P)-binding protein [Curvibacter sp. APW13]MDT8990528.1 NAD(P)-binding protein [Curvibacter sp. APW13]
MRTRSDTFTGVPLQRRDFLNGMAWLGPSWALAQGAGAAAPYPPALTGLRGSAPGTMDAAHALAWGGGVETGTPDSDGPPWDLIVVGAGISGLSAAYFYRQRIKPQARILVLDNHDDVGGHARRNEFSVGGRSLLSYGGTQSFDAPQNYSAQARALLQELGVDMVALRRAYNLDYFRQHGLGMGVHYDAAMFGRDALVASTPPTLRAPLYYSRHYVPGMVAPPAFHTTLAHAPLSAAQQHLLRQVLANTPPRGLRQRDVTEADNYVAFLRDTYRLSDPALVALLSMAMAEDSALGGYAVSMEAAADGGLLGLGSAAQRHQWFGTERRERVADAAPENDDDEDLDGYLFHFPDGGATLARLLLQRLVPGVARFGTAAQCVEARFDYRQLDRPQLQAVNIRLQSTAVSVANTGKGVQVRYVHNGSTRLTQARHVVMAGWSSNTAHVVQGLPTSQKEALRANLKMPMVYAQVVLRRWHALKKSGVAVSYAPASPFQFCQMDFPVRMGRYGPPAHPDEPACLLMIRVPGPVFTEAAPPDIFRAGRAELLGQDFAYYEEAIARQLQGMYGAQGLDAQRDIAAITVNRWGHGYVWEDARYRGQPAHRLAAKPLGRIAMAGSDSEGRAYMDAAIDGAWRAVRELPA